MISDRVRLFVDNHTTEIVILLAVLAALGLWMSYSAHAASATETETVTIDEWSEWGGFEHSAAVLSENEVYPVGTELSQDWYFTEISPILNGTYEYVHTNDEVQSVDIRLQYVIRTVGSDDETLWSVEEELDSVGAVVEADEPVTASWQVDTREIEDAISSIEESLGASIGSPEAVVLADIETRTEAGDHTSHQQELTIEPDAATVDVTQPERLSENHQETEEQETPAAAGMLQAVSGPLLLLVVGLLAGAIVYGRHSGYLPLSATDRARIEYEQQRESLDEWVSVGGPPPSASDLEVISIDTIEDIVDLAMDTNNRVIEDRESKMLFVRTREALYVCEPPIAERNWTDWLEDSQVEDGSRFAIKHGDDDPTTGTSDVDTDLATDPPEHSSNEYVSQDDGTANSKTGSESN